MMKISVLNEENLSRIVLQAKHILNTDGIIISPTDTVYGILGNATSAPAVKRVFELKQRPAEKAFPIFVRDSAMARRYAYISDAKAHSLERVWPGPVTVVFQHKEKLPKILTGGLDTLGLRIPNDPFLAELLKQVDFPIAQTSANISTEPPAQNIGQIKQYFEQAKPQPDLVIDGGEVNSRVSTVIDYTGNEPIVLRTGVVSKEELLLLLHE